MLRELVPDIPDAPMMPGCERLDVYLKQRFPNQNLNPEEIEIRDHVLRADGSEGLAIYKCPSGYNYFKAVQLGFLRPNERPMIMGKWPAQFMHIRVFGD
jgi:hypothetical protein